MGVYKMDEMNHMNTYYVQTLNRALNDLRVIKEILVARDKIKSDYKDAKKRADFWNDGDAKNKSVRSSDLAKKHREIQREEDLRNLKNFVEKLVLGQLNVVYCANTRRWKKSTNLFASKHLLALEKVMSSWKDLANEIAANNGNVDEMSKDVIVETIDDDENEENDDEKREVLDYDETIGNDVDVEDGMDSVPISPMESNEVEIEENELLKQKEDEAEALRLKEEEAENERLRKEKEESERLEREKEEKEKQDRIENLKKEQEKTKEKMNEMFKDENDEKPKDDEFPWDD